MRTVMKQINTSFYDFDRIIEGGYVYVDKTAILYEIAKPGSDGIYYLPRPRRFGKSQLASFGHAAFESSLLNFVGGHCRAMGASSTSASTTIRRPARLTRSEWKPRRIDFQQTGREI